MLLLSTECFHFIKNKYFKYIVLFSYISSLSVYLCVFNRVHILFEEFYIYAVHKFK